PHKLEYRPSACGGTNGPRARRTGLGLALWAGDSILRTYRNVAEQSAECQGRARHSATTVLLRRVLFEMYCIFSYMRLSRSGFLLSEAADTQRAQASVLICSETLRNGRCPSRSCR